MRIHELRLQNFKRFTDLTIKDIPDAAQLVLLIGSNGSGKSCVFDAFNWVVAPAQGFQPIHIEEADPYFQKVGSKPPFPAKDYGKQIPQHTNHNPAQLSQTQWFKQAITTLL